MADLNDAALAAETLNDALHLVPEPVVIIGAAAGDRRPSDLFIFTNSAERRTVTADPENLPRAS